MVRVSERRRERYNLVNLLRVLTAELQAVIRAAKRMVTALTLVQ
jgi:hypothetical protein